MKFIDKIWRKLMKMRLQPIRVYCMHHVSEVFDEGQMHECDWTQINEFKAKVMTMQQDGVEFISLTEAHRHLTTDKWRKAKYAVLTFDDGWSTLMNIIPWLCEQHIPTTLFLNPAYILGVDKREIGTSLTQQELDELLKIGKSYIQIASHGWNHKLCTEMPMSEFEDSTIKSKTFLERYPEYIPFFAYPCGRYTSEENEYLKSKDVIPVLMDGQKNYNNDMIIHRELIR